VVGGFEDMPPLIGRLGLFTHAAPPLGRISASARMMATISSTWSSLNGGAALTIWAICWSTDDLEPARSPST
jgi:hypothetical protein